MYARVAEYQKTEINTSDRLRIITLMYSGAINFINLSKEKMQSGDIAGKGLYIGKATAVVGELINSLDLQQGGKIAENLKALYDFVLDKLIDANLYNKTESLDEAVKVLEVLRDGWLELEKRNNTRTSNDIIGLRNESIRV